MTEALEIQRGSASIKVGIRSGQLPLSQYEKMALCAARGRKQGMRIIEPQIGSHEFPDLDAAKAYRQAADDADITITSAGFFTPFDDPSQKATCRKESEFCFNVAEILGVDYLFILFKNPPEGIPAKESWNFIRDAVYDFSEQAASRGIRISLQPEWYVGTTERVLKLIKDVDHPAFQLINYDPTNLFTHGSDPVDCMRDHYDRIINGHIKDGFYRTNQRHEAEIGKGEVPWQAIFECMLDTGQGFTMHLEHCKTVDEVEAGAAYVRKVFKDISG